MNMRSSMSELPGLYIHVPFCTRRCPYCDFYSVSALDLIPRYVESLAREAEAAAASGWDKPFETLYIGGGSPSLLNGDGLGGLLKALAPLDISGIKEFTLEANPEDVSAGQAELWAESGVTRLSLGVQTFDERWLGDVLGRCHSVADSLKAIEVLKDGRPYDLSLDLIYGMPAQEPEDWGADLRRAAEAGPAHISTYSLTVEPNTPLARSIASRFVPPPPPQEKVADMFLISPEALGMHGYYRYEVSNFALPGHESQHNLKYWHRQPYLGLGPSAHSFDGRRRWANLPSVRQWSSALASGAAPRAFTEELDEKAVRLEQVMLGLRLPEGISEGLLPESERLEQYINGGFLIKSEGRIRPTEKGLLVADRLAVELTD
ncbi:coproporphyrinogen III oxidase [Deltaproteobacteria bacterium Smac51]|nr:coproporphyrinogen III oxidase [Deltaproteobacteria bacterium Smac51]